MNTERVQEDEEDSERSCKRTQTLLTNVLCSIYLFDKDTQHTYGKLWINRANCRQRREIL